MYRRGNPGFLVLLLVIVVVVRIIIRLTKRSGNSNSGARPYVSQPWQTPPRGVAPGGFVPPAPPAQAEWFFVENGASVGPVTWADFCGNVTSGRIHRATLVYGPGMAEWVEAQRLGGLVFPTLPATWTCSKCGQQVVASVGACWNCGAVR